MAKIATIVDRDGDVYTGKVVEKSDTLFETLASGLFLGIPSIAGLADAPSTTVKVNDVEHTGRKI